MSATNQDFEVSTNKGKYSCSLVDEEVGKEHWRVLINYHGSAVGSFKLSAGWARTRVFQFIASIDEGIIV